MVDWEADNKQQITKIKDFSGGLDSKASVYNEGDPGLIRKIAWRRKWQPTPVLLPGKPCGCRSLIDYSYKESDTTEQLHSE